MTAGGVNAMCLLAYVELAVTLLLADLVFG